MRIVSAQKSVKRHNAKRQTKWWPTSAINYTVEIAV